MRKILVAGGMGFIGSHLVDALLRDPDNAVHVVDDLRSSPIGLIDRHIDNSRYTHDICSVAIFYLNAWRKYQWNEIYHLASIVGPASVIDYAGDIAHSVINDGSYMSELARHSNAVLVDVSTSEIYGGGQNGLCSESMNRIISNKHSPRLEYAVGKLASEIALLNTPNLRLRIVRPFNVTGPRQSGKGGFVLPRFIGQAMADAPITVFGDGKQVRAFTHVKDIVDGLIRAARYGTDGSVYNLGNPENKIEVNELASLVRNIVGQKTCSDIIHVDPKTIYGPLYEDANDKYPDATLAMNQLQWRPSRNIETIINDTWSYMMSVPKEMLERLRGF